jgi:hypothetical protein
MNKLIITTLSIICIVFNGCVEKVSFALLLLIMIGFSYSCSYQKKENFDEKVKKDVIKFIGLLPDLPHEDKLAFEKANAILKYKERTPSSRFISFEACSEVAPGKSLMDGQITIYTLSKDSTGNEFTIALSVYPPVKDSTLYYSVNRFMIGHKKISEDSSSVTWQMNDCLLRLKGLNTIFYYPLIE